LFLQGDFFDPDEVKEVGDAKRAREEALQRELDRAKDRYLDAKYEPMARAVLRQLQDRTYITYVIRNAKGEVVYLPKFRPN
jgi:hypothetical protein